VIDNETLEIYELPLKKWTRDYKNFLEELAIQEEIDDIKEFHKDNKISFSIKVSFDLKRMQIEDGAIEKKFKLTSNLSCNNFVLFDRDYHIRRYDNEITILEEFYEVRYSYY
jgi:DNA topoisomerase-2